MALEHVYVVIEAGDEFSATSYDYAYMSFQQARDAVLAKHKETLTAELEESGLENYEALAKGGGSEVMVPENPDGPTILHIETRRISIQIIKLPILNQSGGRRVRKKRYSRRRA